VPADLAPASAAPGALPGSPLRTALRRIAGPVLWPTATSMRRIALAGVVANAAIMSTGAAVRLSKSGLGCPDWPACTRSSIVASHTAGQTTLNTWIEFGNRLLNFPLVAVAAIVFIAAWRYRPPGAAGRRKDLLWLSAALPAGVVAQAVLGGIVVLTKLDPVWVSIHFLTSTAIVGAAVMLHVRCGEGAGPATPLVRREIRVLGGALVAVVGVMVAAGTVVTGTGPLAGSADTPRYHLPLIGVTQFHADIGWLMAGVTTGLMAGLVFSGAPRRAVVRGWIFVGLLLVQGAIGYAQYFSGLPAGLVWVHVTTAVLVWIAALRLFFALRDRGPAETGPAGPAGEMAAGAAGGAGAAGAAGEPVADGASAAPGPGA
jgi:cytochrome c oxidase assembly protein subunit 15